jgi:hypothetical protein
MKQLAGSLLVGVLTFGAAQSRAHHFHYVASLSGAAEDPANDSSATGFVHVALDLDLATMHVAASFAGLSGTTTQAHIHGLTTEPGVGMADVATMLPSFADFPAGVTSGDYEHEFDLTQASSYSASFIASQGGTVGGAFNAFISGMASGKTYFNVHTTAYQGGEIRGFLLTDPESDFDRNGAVDGDDLALWTQSFDLDESGDANSDDVSDGLDLLLWQQQLGDLASLPVPLAVAVPEPSSAAGLGAWLFAGAPCFRCLFARRLSRRRA